MQNNFTFFWRPGDENEADYHTKRHSTKNHRHQRLQKLNIPTSSTKVRNYDTAPSGATLEKHLIIHTYANSINNVPKKEEKLLNHSLNKNKNFKGVLNAIAFVPELQNNLNALPLLKQKAYQRQICKGM